MHRWRQQHTYGKYSLFSKMALTKLKLFQFTQRKIVFDE